VTTEHSAGAITVGWLIEDLAQRLISGSVAEPFAEAREIVAAR
jgi:hypothetical protein